jgi:hypothetical protein
MPTVQPLPKQYSAETFFPNGDRWVLHAHGVMERFEMFPKTGPALISIRRPDKGVEWSLSPDTNAYSETVVPPESEFAPPPPLEWNDDGTEMIAGHQCWRFVGRYREALFRLNGEAANKRQQARTVCYVDVQTGMRRREIHYDVNGELVATTDYWPDSPPANLFELPEGWKPGDPGRKGVGG